MKKTLLVIVSSLVLIFVTSFVLDESPKFKIGAMNITAKDVVFKNPKGFPKPIYNLKNNKITPEGFTLGRKLFYDPMLSFDYSTSCASCHQQFAAFSHLDHTLSHGVKGGITKRNAPALQNLIWKDAFMADGGINHLDLQPIAPITNEKEMGDTLSNILKKLRADSSYRFMFYKAFGDSVITSERLMKSFSQFLALIISCNSKYDNYSKGKEEFTINELNGLKLFRINCSKCHPEPLFTDNNYYFTGFKPGIVKEENGRQGITSLKEDYLKFKTPSLRNIEKTYPYMHDGRFFKLEEVMNHYAKSEFCANSKFSEQDKIDIISFLKTLTDVQFLNDRRFADPNFK